jgi:hypothetical protein
MYSPVGEIIVSAGVTNLVIEMKPAFGVAVRYLLGVGLCCTDLVKLILFVWVAKEWQAVSVKKRPHNRKTKSILRRRGNFFISNTLA